MIISHRYKFIFIKTFKTAGTSIEAYLSRYCADQDIFTPTGPRVPGHSPRNYTGYFNPFPELIGTRASRWKATLKQCYYRKKYWEHMPAYILKTRLSSRVWDQYYKFCVERNPWDKTISYYYFLTNFKDRPMSFDQFLVQNEWCINYPMYTEYSDKKKLMVDRVLSYENLNNELGEVFDNLGVPFSGSLDVFAKSEYRKDRRPYQEFLTKSQAELITKNFRHEIKMFGYAY